MRTTTTPYDSGVANAKMMIPRIDFDVDMAASPSSSISKDQSVL